MKFQYTRNTTRLNGQLETHTESFDGDSVILGRGGRSNLLVRSNLLSLEHAAFLLEEGALYVQPASDNAVVRVNGIPASRELSPTGEAQGGQRLKAGDSITLADVELTVKQSAEHWEVVHAIKEEEKTDEEAERAALLDKVNVKKRFPSVNSLSITGAALIAAFFFMFPFTGGSKQSWNSGPISKPHRMIANNCESCHYEPFSRVRDQECKVCHEMSSHDEFFEAHPEEEVRCADCHLEHNGDYGMTPRDSRLCTDCHSNITGFKAEAEAINVPSMNQHPQFRVAVGELKEDGERLKISLNDKENLKDPTPIKLNHALHLKEGLRGPDGPTTLACADCHSLNEDFATIKPIKFETACQSCHTLGFDERLPGNEVPHGNADTVYNYVYAEYAKLFLESSEGQGNEEFDLRRIPGYQAEEMSAEEQTAFAQQVILSEARGAEQLLFTRTACYLCHQVTEKPDLDESEPLSRYEVLKPNIPDRWMPASIFGHGAHEEISCESCHEGVNKSEVTTDVLLPPIETCQECHHDEHKPGFVHSDCVTCHSYHDSLELAPERKRDIHSIVKGLQQSSCEG